VADHERDGRARQNAAVEQLVREPEHVLAKRRDEQQLDEVVERETEEAVEAAAQEPWHRSEAGVLCHFEQRRYHAPGYRAKRANVVKSGPVMLRCLVDYVAIHESCAASTSRSTLALARRGLG